MQEKRHKRAAARKDALDPPTAWKQQAAHDAEEAIFQAGLIPLEDMPDVASSSDSGSSSDSDSSGSSDTVASEIDYVIEDVPMEDVVAEMQHEDVVQLDLGFSDREHSESEPVAGGGLGGQIYLAAHA